MDLPAFMMSGVVPGVAVLTTLCWVTPDGPMSTKQLWVPDEVVITKSSYIMVFLSIFVGNFGHFGPKKGELPDPQVLSWFCHGPLGSIMVLSWFDHGWIRILSYFCHGSLGSIMVLSWFCHGSLVLIKGSIMVLSWSSVGSIMVLSWFYHGCTYV